MPLKIRGRALLHRPGLRCWHLLPWCFGRSAGQTSARPFCRCSAETIPLAVVTDSKDCYDNGCSDTPSHGSQKSLCFSVAWLRSQLAKENTMLKWTNTENMFVDCGTKEMSSEHVHRILDAC